MCLHRSQCGKTTFLSHGSVLFFKKIYIYTHTERSTKKASVSKLGLKLLIVKLHQFAWRKLTFSSRSSIFLYKGWFKIEFCKVTWRKMLWIRKMPFQNSDLLNELLSTRLQRLSFFLPYVSQLIQSNDFYTYIGASNCIYTISMPSPYQIFGVGGGQDRNRNFK